MNILDSVKTTVFGSDANQVHNEEEIVEEWHNSPSTTSPTSIQDTGKVEHTNTDIATPDELQVLLPTSNVEHKKSSDVLPVLLSSPSLKGKEQTRTSADIWPQKHEHSQHYPTLASAHEILSSPQPSSSADERNTAQVESI